MPGNIIGYAAAVSLALALSITAISNASAAPQWGDDGFAAGPAPSDAIGPSGGYYDYAAGPFASPPYYNYYGSDDYILARPAFPPGCGAGRPHC
jgi:hypothetical protein